MSFLLELARVNQLLKKTQVRFRFLYLSVLGSIIITPVNIYSLWLLFPLSHGIVVGNFSGVKALAVIGPITRYFPSLFVTDRSLLFLLVSWLGVVNLFRSTLNYLVSVTIRKEATVAGMAIRFSTLDRFMKFGKLYYDQNNTTNLTSQLIACTIWIESILVAFQLVVSDIFTLSLYLALMTFISWKLTLSVLLVAPLILFSSKILRKNLEKTSESYSRSLEQLTAKTHQMIAALALVQASGKTHHEREQIRELSQKEIGLSEIVYRLQALFGPLHETCVTIGYLLIGWSISFFELPHASIASRLFVFFLLASKLVFVVGSIGRFGASLSQHLDSIDLFEGLMKDDDKYIIKSGNKEFSGEFHKIEFRNLKFEFPHDRVVFKNISFSIHRGEMVALVGSTGSGKTTLVNLILRFYDCPPDSILIDGVDIREFNTDSIRSHISYVSQDAPLMNDTIRANICYPLGRLLSNQELESILKASKLADFVDSLPQKLDTTVGERGTKLSGGERQRIAIARALVRNSKILIFDEPSSALDIETERAIVETIESLRKDKTVILISHRTSTFRKSDRIAVLDQGKMIQFGKFDDLLQEEGRFRQLLHQEESENLAAAADSLARRG